MALRHGDKFDKNLYSNDLYHLRHESPDAVWKAGLAQRRDKDPEKHRHRMRLFGSSAGGWAGGACASGEKQDTLQTDLQVSW